MKNKTLDLKNEKDCESFVYAFTGLTLNEYARKILEQFNEEKKKVSYEPNNSSKKYGD